MKKNTLIGIGLVVALFLIIWAILFGFSQMETPEEKEARLKQEIFVVLQEKESVIRTDLEALKHEEHLLDIEVSNYELLRSAKHREVTEQAKLHGEALKELNKYNTKELTFEEKSQMWEYLGDWELTTYYSPEPDQANYFAGGTYKEDFYMNCSNTCEHTADGTRLTNEHIYTAVACPRTLELGTKLFINGLGEVVCRDRGGAIKGQRLDVWAGWGEMGLDNVYRFGNPTVAVYLIP